MSNENHEELNDQLIVRREKVDTLREEGMILLAKNSSVPSARKKLKQNSLINQKKNLKKLLLKFL